MSEVTDLTLIEIKPEQAPELYAPNGLDAYLEKIREMAKEVPDVKTQKGRDRIGSLARSVGSSKKAIEEPGRAYLKHLKELPKEVEAELRRFVNECDTIRNAILKPRVEWEQAEESRKNALQQRLNDLRALGDVMSADGNYLPSVDIQARISEAKSIALDDSWEEVAAEAGVAKDATIQKLESAFIVSKKREDQAAELERLRVEAEEKARVEREEKLKREAAEAARLEAEKKAQEEREAAARRELELKMQAEQAERARVEAEQRAEREKKEAAERAEREKQAAIDEQKRRAQEEAVRIRREAEAKEATRIAEQQRIADEAAARAANEKHRKAIGAAVVKALTEHTSISREQAIEVLTALKNGLIPNSGIHY
ncbi:hypothetical protein [Phytobacter diazotrophicus]|uniref:hypothetical protein n=1 Tax=Phytobacter diazotrophicus TaxID=395631 RepID=UPI002FF6E62D